jgi:electron transfer flavoprotein beta subunit
VEELPVQIVVLMKAVPVVGTERLDDAFRTNRAQLEANGNDEYTLEKALKLTETHGGEVSVLTLGPASAAEALRKALAMGAARAFHVQDDALAGSDVRATVSVLAAALGRIPFDLAFTGADTSDGLGGVVGAAVAARLQLPYLSYAGEIEPTADGAGVRVHRLSPAGYDVLEAATPAVVMGTQVLGAPRYPSLRGIMQARTKETTTWSLADLGIDAGSVGAAAATTRTLSASPPPQRAGATIVKDAPDAAVQQVVDFLASRRLI